MSAKNCPKVDLLDFERLGAGEGEQLLGQARSTLRRIRTPSSIRFDLFRIVDIANAEVGRRPGSPSADC